MTGLAAAFGFEWLKLRHSMVMWVSTVVLTVVVPLAATGFLMAADSSSHSQLAVKARTMITDTGWPAQLSLAGQLFSVAGLIGAGIVACWIFGREFTDHTFGSLLALAVSPGRLAVAKFGVLLAWGMAASLIAAAATVAMGFSIGLGASTVAFWEPLARLIGVHVLTVVLTTPLAFAASAGRGHLSGIGVLFGLLAVTQVAVVAGLGAWFPYV